MTDQKLLGALYSWGADPDRAIDRLLGDEGFYIDLVKKFAAGIDTKKIRELSDTGYLDGAFMMIHRMKGAAADLSLTPLYEILDELTEELRPKRHGLSEDQLNRFEECVDSFLVLLPKTSWHNKMW